MYYFKTYLGQLYIHPPKEQMFCIFHVLVFMLSSKDIVTNMDIGTEYKNRTYEWTLSMTNIPIKKMTVRKQYYGLSFSPSPIQKGPTMF